MSAGNISPIIPYILPLILNYRAILRFYIYYLYILHIYATLYLRYTKFNEESHENIKCYII